MTTIVKANQTYADKDGDMITVISVRQAGKKADGRFGRQRTDKIVVYQIDGINHTEWCFLEPRDKMMYSDKGELGFLQKFEMVS